MYWFQCTINTSLFWAAIFCLIFDIHGGIVPILLYLSITPNSWFGTYCKISPYYTPMQHTKNSKLYKICIIHVNCNKDNFHYIPAAISNYYILGVPAYNKAVAQFYLATLSLESFYVDVQSRTKKHGTPFRVFTNPILMKKFELGFFSVDNLNRDWWVITSSNKTEVERS